MDIVPNMSALSPDKSPGPVWQAVGTALSFWEAAEINLAGLYLIFKGQPRTVENLIAYGDHGRVFSERMKTLKHAAETYFAKHPNQEHEGAFRDVCGYADELARFRHQIAHGIVMPNHGNWWLMPPWYTEKLNYSGDIYFYCAGQIDGIGKHFTALQVQTNRLKNELPAP